MNSRNSSGLTDRAETRLPFGLDRKAAILWLVALSALLLIVPLLFASRVLDRDIDRLGSGMQQMQDELLTVSAPEPEVEGLRGELADVDGAIEELESLYSSISGGSANWSGALAAVADFDPLDLTLLSIAQEDKRLTLTGQARDDAAVIDYARSLEETGLFSRVVVQSVRTIADSSGLFSGTQESNVTASATSTYESAASATATPASDVSQSDVYETDDFSPKDIFLGSPQLHSFDPIYDVDQVKFLAKAGRCYRVSTSALAPGVDTLLTVIVGSSTFSNDDQGPGKLSSEVVVEGLSSDVEAVVRVTNRGLYGNDRRYQLTVEEIIPTPTATSQAAQTPTSTATATPTPDVRDQYEPDDESPGLISVSTSEVQETQTHSFHSPDDVDKVTFSVKAGRLYALTTSELALGVDTQIEISIGGTVCGSCTNDDLAVGTFDSEVRLVPSSDATAVATITNDGGQSGPDKTYDLTLTLLSVYVDAYEPDDYAAKPVVVGETQTHNFYPDDDLDRVSFTAKAGRSYRVSTFGLSSGVDTVVTVKWGGFKKSNDDRGAGDLGSQVDLTVGGEDVRASVDITNQGRYGPTMWYKIGIEELTPTPTPTNTPVVSPTAATVAAVGPWSRKVPGRACPAVGERDRGASLRRDSDLQGVWDGHSFSTSGASRSSPASAMVEFVIVLEMK
jgi:Tfp pilus assembly protein PilN